MKSKLENYAALGLLGYFLLLVLLMVAERDAPGSAINNLGDAFWYSIVTLSTVGYGDMYPVTPVGRIIGFCFVLMSLGVLSFVVGTVVSRIGRLYPALLLRLNRDKQWYVFDCADPRAFALANDLHANDPHSLFLFPHTLTDQVTVNGNVLFYHGTVTQAVKGKADRCSLFFMDTHRETDNYKSALAALPLGLPIYCCTEQMPADCPDNLTLFDHSECCAREYWRTHGLCKDETAVLLIGDGRYARRLLEQALLVNVFCPDHRVSYHLFGDWSDFRRCHPRLGDTIAIDAARSYTDCIFFHSRPWNADAELLTDAHRIILCDDREEINLELLSRLRRYFPLRGRVHLRAAEDIPGETVFGTTETTCTADLILRGELTQTARTMHQIYVDGSNGQAPRWDQLSNFTRQSNMAAADHLLTKVRILLADDTITALSRSICAAAYVRYCETKAERCEEYRAAEHLRWMRFHSLYNWRYAPVRDNAARLHPLLRPFEELPASEQVKDDYAWELLDKLAQQMQ